MCAERVTDCRAEPVLESVLSVTHLVGSRGITLAKMPFGYPTPKKFLGVFFLCGLPSLHLLLILPSLLSPSSFFSGANIALPAHIHAPCCESAPPPPHVLVPADLFAHRPHPPQSYQGIFPEILPSLRGILGRAMERIKMSPLVFFI